MLTKIWEVNKSLWVLSRSLSIDEQTVGFQGRGEGAVRITYKNEGDGYQVHRIPASQTIGPNRDLIQTFNLRRMHTRLAKLAKLFEYVLG